ncbi:MAG: AgmX/PglI C-terminal domain-containing protein [Myxococcota bacterium]
MAQDNSSISFSIYHAGKLVREVDFDRPIINVGKLSTSNLRLEDDNVSRKHAVLERRENGEWRITDLGSTNGTLVNGKQVTQAVLRDGDRVLLGNTTLVPHLSEEARAAAATAAGGEAGGAPISRPMEEIQGLGETTFYEDEGERREGETQALEIALLWGETVLSIEHFTRPEPVWVGEKPGSRFTLPQEVLGTDSYPLIEVKHGKFALNLSNQTLQGDVLIDGSVMPLGELAKEGRLDNQYLLIEGPMRARLRVGDFILLVSYGPMPERPRVSPLASVDYTPHIYIALSAILHIAFLVFLSLMPEEQLRTSMDPRARAKKLIDVIKVSEEEEQEEEELEEEEVEPEPGEGEDEMAVADTEIEQEMKQPQDSLVDKLRPQDRQQKPDLSDLSPEERQEKAREMAATAGAAKTLGEESELLDSLLSSDQQPMLMDGKRITALTSTADDADPMAGGGAIDPFGGGTLAAGSGGFAGTGSVGGGPGGEGGPAVAGLGKEGGRDLNDIQMRERDIKPVAIASKATVSGRLDRKTVQQIIRRNMSGIKWCYQDALQRNRRLRGKVALVFNILPNGRVQGEKAVAQGGSINDAEMLRCIQRKIGRLRFPKPKGAGGLVKVSYPVILKTR